MKDIIESLCEGIIVSCQAYQDTPLYGSENMALMAKSAELGGATGIRSCWPGDIKAVKKAVSLPIIGINKIDLEKDQNPLDYVIITPTFESAEEIIKAGCDILALDCTIRPSRPLDDLIKLLEEIRQAFPDIPIMADLATLDEAKKMSELGYVDIISTTLSGYTRQSLDRFSDKPDLEMIKDIKKITDLPVNAEGRIWELDDLKKVKQAGADMVTIGTSITRPHLITKRFVDYNDSL